MHRKKQERDVGGIIISIVAIVIAIIMLMPLIWALFCSLQSDTRQFVTIWDWFKPPYTLKNYPKLIMGSHVFRWFLNSLIVAVVSTVITVVVCTMAAYAIAKIHFPGSHAIYGYFMLGMMVPTEATIIPLFLEVNKMHMIGTYAGLILPGIASASTLMIAVSFFKSLPEPLLEAARIDGGNAWTIYFRIVLPLSKPIVSTIALLTFIASWNNYLWPLLSVYSDKMYTLPIGIPTLLSINRPNYVVPMTANMIASLPIIILYLVFERQIVQGITMDGIKG